MDEFLSAYFSWPILPASVLLVCVCAYWIFVIAGVLDLDLFDFDLDMDLDADADSTLGVGFIGLRFFNLGSVPLMIWLSIFALVLWLISVGFGSPAADTAKAAMAVAVARNFGIALILTKFLTAPLVGRFDVKEPNRPEDLMGRTCTVITSSVTAEFGRARVDTEAAPLLLNVRMNEESLKQGEQAQIVAFDPETHLYVIERLAREV